MTLTWLIEADVFGEASEGLKTALRARGIPFSIVKHRPHAPKPRDILGAEQLPHEARVILLASHPLIQHIQKNRRWTPGPWCQQENFECASYYAFFGPYLLNQNYTLLPGVEAIRHRDRLFQNPGNGRELFIRPSSVEKIFTGKVATPASLVTDLAPTRYDPRTLVLAAEPRNLRREWRVVIANGRAVTASQYRDGDKVEAKLGAPKDVFDFVEMVLREVNWRPDPLFMMDICECDDRLWLLELNSFSGSGLYRCDLDAIIEAAMECAQATY